MSFYRMQPEFNSVLDTIDEMKERIIMLERRCHELEEENTWMTNKMYEIADALDERIDIMYNKYNES